MKGKRGCNQENGGEKRSEGEDVLRRVIRCKGSGMSGNPVVYQRK